jgi:hypothetical protein
MALSVSARPNRVIFAIVVSLAIVFATALYWQEGLRLLLNAEGFRPSATRIASVGSLFLVMWLVVFLIGISVEGVKRDHADYIAGLRAASSPVETTAASYQARGFAFHSNLVEGASSPQVWAKTQRELDSENLYRQAGALIYPDGSATQFSIAVLYRDDVWSLGDEINVRRRQMGRPVTIRTALNRPLIRELIQSNDYVLGVGLASSSPTRAEERNENLAHARAFNIGYAIQRLNLQDARRVYGVSLGYATQSPPIADQEAMQRAVVLIGINASSDVRVADVVDAATRLIALDGLDISQYSRAGARAVRFRTIQGDDYLRVADVKVEARNDGDWVLSAVAP